MRIKTEIKSDLQKAQIKSESFFDCSGCIALFLCFFKHSAMFGVIEVFRTTRAKIGLMFLGDFFEYYSWHLDVG